MYWTVFEGLRNLVAVGEIDELEANELALWLIGETDEPFDFGGQD